MSPEELERFWKKVRVSTFGCWQWTATRNNWGYGQFWHDGKHRLAHRFAYQHFVGPISDGLQVDHLCKNRTCVNPAHTEPVTGRENILRGISSPAKNARKTHCHRGHVFAEENTTVYRRKHGSLRRRCLACHRLACGKWRLARKAKLR